MSAAGKKYKLFKVCKELNVGMETLSSFLQEKGVAMAGPNTSFSEDIYNEILENFAREKEIADQLHLRKTRKDDDEHPPEAEEHGTESVVEKSKYIRSIERSIEERIEEIKRKEEEKEEPKPKKRTPRRTVAEEDEKQKGDQFVKAAREILETEPAPAEEEAKRKAVEKEEAPEGAAKPAAAEKKPEQTAKKKDGTEVEVKPAAADAPEESKKTKEDKRRKALEMIRKDEKRKKNLLRIGDVDSIEGGRRQRPKRQKRKSVDQKEVQQTVKKTLASLDDKLKRTKRRKKIRTETGEEIEKNVIYASEFISANDLANLMDPRW